MAKSKTKTVLFVLGMHRSGTSVLTGLLAKLGAGLPRTLMPEHATNATGFFESTAVMDTNNRILAEGGSRWKDWRAFSLTPEKTEQAIERISQVLEAEFSDSDFIALKDPRVCRMAPLWLEAAHRNGYAPRVLLPYRNPMEVADSLNARDGLAVPEGLLIWLRHVLDAEYVSRELPRVFVPMAGLLDDWRSNVELIGNKLKIDWPVSPQAVSAEIDRFVNKGLRHQIVPREVLETDSLLSGWIAETYKCLETLTLADDATAQNYLDTMRLDLNAAGDLFGPAMEDKNGRIGNLERQYRVINQSFETTKTEAALELDKLAAERDRAVEGGRHETAEKLALSKEFEAFRARAMTKQVKLMAERDEAFGKHRQVVAAQEKAAAELALLQTRALADSEVLKAETTQATLDSSKMQVLLETQLAAAIRERDALAGEQAVFQAQALAEREALKAEATQATLDSSKTQVLLETQLAAAIRERDALALRVSTVLEEVRSESEMKETLHAQLDAMTVDRNEHTRLLNRYRCAARVHFLAWAFNKGLRPA